MPAGFDLVWVQNIGLSKLFGDINWRFHDPGRPSAHWRRLLARYALFPHLFLFEVAARPMRKLWAVVTGKSAQSALPAPSDHSHHHGFPPTGR